MKSIKNMLLNEIILGYVPSAIDPNRVVDSVYNLQVHLPHKYIKEEAEYCVSNLRRLIPSQFPEFDQVTVTLVRHKPHDGSYYHHMSTKEVQGIDPLKLVYQVYSRHIAGHIRSKTKHGCYADSVTPSEVFVANKDSKPTNS